MMKSKHTQLCASAAIAAVLALNSSPLLAQMAPAPTTTPVAPTTVPAFPETAVAPPPQQTAPVQTAPVPTPTVQPIVVPDIQAAPAEPATATATRTTAARTTAAPAPARSNVVRAATAPVAAPADPAPAMAETPVETVPPVAPVAVDTTPAEPATTDNGDSTLLFASVLGGLAALALAIWGFVAIGRRKPVDRKAATLIERPVVTPRAPQPATVAAAPVASERPFASTTPTQINTVAPAPSLAHTGAAVPLPRTMPATFEERDALLRKMIAARPDRANPFTSPLQRRKRAKLILQSLGNDFGGRDPWIDLSQYPQNWPELARKQAAA